MNKWLPSTLGRTALCVSGGGSQTGPKSAQAIVTQFLTSHASIHPVMVISYEMFRTYATALNTCDSLDVLVCDEGHRLKNACGTSTTLALGNAIAMRRLVLTGTPIQNNLEELYAVVQFVVPGYLGNPNQIKLPQPCLSHPNFLPPSPFPSGTLSEFKKKYSDPIAKGKLAGASARAVKGGHGNPPLTPAPTLALTLALASALTLALALTLA